MSEAVLSEETWPDEANAVIRDIANQVKEATISTLLKNTNQCIHINLTTLEERRYCVEMTARGFRIVGEAHDVKEKLEGETRFYETPYSLLQSISDGYSVSFGQELMSKLGALENLE